MLYLCYKYGGSFFFKIIKMHELFTGRHFYSQQTFYIISGNTKIPTTILNPIILLHYACLFSIRGGG